MQVTLRRTFDSSATPRGGQAVATPKKLAAVELTKLKEKLAATIERAKADDPKALRAEPAAVRQQLAKATAAAATPRAPAKVDTRTVEKPVLKDVQVARLEKVADQIAAQGSG